jgi:hypothetical protein
VRRFALAALLLAALALAAALLWALLAGGGADRARRPPADPGASPANAAPPALAAPAPAPARAARREGASRPPRAGAAASPLEGVPTPSAAATPLDAGAALALEGEPPVGLRPVSGLVRDARTKAPIQGAWVAWRLPPPRTVEQVFLEGTDRLAAPGPSMVTDAEGRFRVERLADDAPRSNVVYAVARGYAYGAARVGLRREVTIDLEPAGALEVELLGQPRDPAPRLEVAPEWGDPSEEARIVLDALPRWEEEASARLFRLAFLRPGRYRLALDGVPAGSAEVPAGGTGFALLSRAPLERVAGAAVGPEGPLVERNLLLVAEEGGAEVELRTDGAGRFEGEAPAGRHAAYLVDGSSLRVLEGGVEGGAGEASLRLGGRGDPVRLTVRLDGRPLEGDDVGLLRMGARLPDLVHLAPEGEGVYSGAAPPGPYGLFRDRLLLAEVRLPEESDAALDLRTRALSVAWLVPDDLEDGERLRGRVALVPLFIAADARLRPRFLDGGTIPFEARRGGPPLTLPVVAPGDYILLGESDLGPFEAPVRVPAGKPFEVRLVE